MSMDLDVDIIKNRLREAFGTDSQETVGRKLSMTQGNVSKLLSGTQQPTLETIYHIAVIYDVSADWILGISDNKKVSKRTEGTTYTTAIQNLQELIRHGAFKMKENDGVITFRLTDPLISMLIKKSVTLYETDRELFHNWTGNKLSLFQDRQVIWENTWSVNGLDFLSSKAVNESDWLEVWDKAKEAEDNWDDMMGEKIGPFGG